MKRELLKLIPTQYLCPVCGQWHDWSEREENLEWFEPSHHWAAELYCPYEKNIHKKRNRCEVYFDDIYCHYRIEPLGECDEELKKIAISDIKQSPDDCTVIFDMYDTCFGFRFKMSEYYEIVNKTK